MMEWVGDEIQPAGWFHWAISFFRVSPVLSVATLVIATALMLLSSAAAICSCILCIQGVGDFWQEAGSSSKGSGEPRTRSCHVLEPFPMHSPTNRLNFSTLMDADMIAS